jgi:thioredoxin reductase (NADPH)
VTIATRDEKLSASKVIADKIEAHPRMDVLPNVTPAEFKGNGKLSSVVLKDTKSGELRELMVPGVFVFIGLTPNTEIFKGVIELDEAGFIVTDGMLQTSMAGVFAAGDVRRGSTKQAASAAGEGAAAALAMRRYIEPLASGMPRHEDMMVREEVMV